MEKTTLSRLGSLIALFALMVLPLASCGDGEITGPGLFRMDGAELHKILVAVAAISAALGLFYVSRNAQIGLGGLGLAALAVSALMVVQDGSADTQVRYGTWVAAAGFMLALVAGLTSPEVSIPVRKLPAKKSARKKAARRR
ncbi:MAG: hypothetical protein KIT70_06480 [Anaerolineales bacterium]|nr:MAG: hypothetical protein KIT70_06480 [Anaerolineales bacterium]